MRPPGLLLVASVALAFAGCMDGADGTDPFANACDFPEVEMGGNAALVGGVATPDGRPVEDVEARAVPQDAGLEDVVDTTNQAGCYYLSVDADAVYDVHWQRDGFAVERQDAVRVPAGEKQVQHVVLRPF